MDGTQLLRPTIYRQLVGILIYVITTRPDIYFIVYLVSKFMSAHRSTHYVDMLSFYAIPKALCFMVFIFQLIPLLNCDLIVIQIGGGDPTDR